MQATRPRDSSGGDSRGPMGPTWRVAAAAVALMVATGQAARAADEEAPFCARAVTTEELAAIAPGFEPMGATEYSEGHSECSWMLGSDGASGTVSMTFWEPSGLGASMIPAESTEELYDMLVSSAAEVAAVSPETIPGVGKRSALFRLEGQRTVYVLTSAGVGYLVTGGLDEAKVKAVAAAMATP
jgi:hypothetical protein